MKKILIISDGIVGERFIERVIETYTSDNIYYIVQMKNHKYENVPPNRFKFHTFDPTSFSKLSNLLKMEFIQVIITMDSVTEIENTIKNIRLVKKHIQIIVLDQHGVCKNEHNVTSVKANDILASRLLDYLPNVPVIAQNVGLGEGEIMEVLVPFGSSFVYRHIGAIEQKDWKITAIYRNRKLILPEPRRLIYPNDLLLIVGNPSVLQSVYRSMKKELGQFPAPFGTNLYVIIDIANESEDSIKDLVRRSVYLHKQFKHDLYLKVINANNFEVLEYIKTFNNTNVIVDVNYSLSSIDDIILQDINMYHVGLVVVSKASFEQRKMRKILFEGRVPVLKIANKSVSKLKEAVAIISDNKELEKVATTIFDISMQLDLNMEIYNYTLEHQESKIQTIEHFNNLSTIFSKSIKVFENEKNPLRLLKKRENFLHCLPFTSKIAQYRISTIFSTDSDMLYYLLNDYHQIFIPSQI